MTFGGYSYGSSTFGGTAPEVRICPSPACNLIIMDEQILPLKGQENKNMLHLCH